MFYDKQREPQPAYPAYPCVSFEGLQAFILFHAGLWTFLVQSDSNSNRMEMCHHEPALKP